MRDTCAGAKHIPQQLVVLEYPNLRSRFATNQGHLLKRNNHTLSRYNLIMPV